MRKTILVSGLTIVPLLAAFAYSTSPSSAQRASSLPGAEESAKLARLERELNELRHEAAQKKADPSQQPKTQTPEEYFVQVESAFAGESRDHAWNPRAALDAKIGEVLPKGSALRSLECKRSMCRMETVHRSAENYRNFAKSFTALREDGPPLWTGPTFFHRLHQSSGAGEPLVSVAYLGRESLPAAAY
jgi:hypothetical protein